MKGHSRTKRNPNVFVFPHREEDNVGMDKTQVRKVFE